MSLRQSKSLFSIALFLVIAACTNTEDEARQALLALNEQYGNSQSLEFQITKAWFDE